MPKKRETFKKRPPRRQAEASTNTVHNDDSPHRLPGQAPKTQPVIALDHPLRQHPDFQRLLADDDFFWRPMLASVARPSTIGGEVAQLRTFAHDNRQEVARLGDMIAQLASEIRTARSATSINNILTTPRPRVEIPPAVIRRLKGVTR